MANYPQELAQDAVCQSHTGHMTGLWFLPARPLRLNTNEYIYIYFHNVIIWIIGVSLLFNKKMPNSYLQHALWGRSSFWCMIESRRQYFGQLFICGVTVWFSLWQKIYYCPHPQKSVIHIPPHLSNITMSSACLVHEKVSLNNRII